VARQSRYTNFDKLNFLFIYDRMVGMEEIRHHKMDGASYKPIFEGLLPAKPISAT